MFVDTPGFLPGTKQERGGVIRHGAKLVHAFAEASVPKVTVVLRKAFGGAFIAMNSRDLGADYVFAWPQATLGVMGAKQAVGIVKRRDIAAADDPEAARDAYAERVRDEHLTAAVAAAEGYVDEIVAPADTRRRLIEALRSLEAVAPSRARGQGTSRCDAGTLLDGKKLLITGVITRDSIAWEVARQAQEAGRRVVLTGFGRAKRLTDRAAKTLPGRRPTCSSSTSTSPRTSRRSPPTCADRWGRVDGVLHAIAFAPGGRARRPLPLHAARERDHRVPDERLLVQGARRRARRPLSGGGRGVVGMDFDATVAWPVYDWMGVAKAALEATSRYLARDLGPRGVRVNLVSAGPLGTIAARGIPGFAQLADAWEQAGAARLGHGGRRPGRRRGLLPALRPGARRSPARSSTSTAASTRWARRSRAWRARRSARSRRRRRRNAQA